MDSAEVTEIKRHFDVTTTDVKRHFGVVAEGLRADIRQVAEGLVGLDERLVRFEEKVEARFDAMDRRFEETQAMIKFSHAELDRRIRALEEGHANLEARVQRLEAEVGGQV